MDSKVKYQVEVTKTGDGAKLTVAEFVALQKAAQSTNATLNTSTQQFSGLNGAAKTTTAGFQSLRVAVTALGFQAFPQLTAAGMAAGSALNGIRAAALATGVGVGALSVALAGVAAAAATAVTGMGALKAMQQNWQSDVDLSGTTGNIRFRLKEMMDRMVKDGQLTAQGAGTWKQLLYSSDDPAKMRENNALVQAQLRFIQGTESQIEAVKKFDAVNREMLNASLSGYDLERKKAHDVYAERIKQLDALSKAAGSKISDGADKLAREQAKDELDAAMAIAEKNRQQKIAIEQQAALAAAAKATAEQIAQFEQDLTIASLSSSADRKQIAEDEFRARTDFYEELTIQGAIGEEELTRLTKQAQIERLRGMKETQRETRTEIKATQTEIQKLGALAQERFADGFANAFVDMISSAKSAQEAFSEFARSVVSDLAKMAMRMAVMNIFSSILGGAGNTANPGWGTAATIPSNWAGGGVRFAANGLMSVSQPTYFPKFNVVAGEAGRELLTVLARPRMMEVGGIQAAVGNAGGSRLAITNADELAARGGGGVAEIRITMEPGLQAEIVNNSIEGAVVRVTQDAGRHTRLRQAIKSA